MPKRTLNLGCGEDTYGTDRIDIRETPATTLVHDLEKGIPFPDNFFDELYSKNLLEHLRNVGIHLEECYRVLKKGGRLVIITDNAACSRFYSLGTHEGRYENKHKNNPDDKHYGIFTRQHLKNHLEKAGFSVKEISLIKTDTTGRFLDRLTGQLPRIKAVAEK